MFYLLGSSLRRYDGQRPALLENDRDAKHPQQPGRSTGNLVQIKTSLKLEQNQL